MMEELLSDSCPRQIETMWGAKHNHHWQHDLQADAEAVLNILVAETGQKKHVSVLLGPAGILLKWEMQLSLKQSPIAKECNTTM